MYLGTAICSSAYLMILEFTNKSKTVIYDLPGYLLIGTGTYLWLGLLIGTYRVGSQQNDPRRRPNLGRF